MKVSREGWVHGFGICILLLINTAGNPWPPGAVAAHYLPLLFALWLIIVAQWLGIVFVVRRSWRQFPALGQVRARLLVSFLCSVVWVAPLMMLAAYLMESVLPAVPYRFAPGLAAQYLFSACILCFTVIGATEAIYYHTRLLSTQQENATLQRLHLLTRYDSLRPQVNPHFLFNSLNTLSSLIAIDPPRAESFVQEMSTVYRYLLQSNRDDLVSLGKELKFISSYLHMLLTRFGQGLRITVDVPSQYHALQLPPLTLQLLVENAVKHNEVSSENPLCIRIFIDGEDRLLIVNNLQKKIVPAPSDRIGLTNIMTKYRLLGLPEVEVLETEADFSVALPLVGPVAATGVGTDAQRYPL